MVELLDRARGCLIGGAIGDALGYPVEFSSTKEILRDHGAATPDKLDYAGPALISDDTQMTLFVAEGILRTQASWLAAAVAALLRWFETQKHDGAHAGNGWLLSLPALHEKRAPGNTNMTACRALAEGGAPAAVLRPSNDSKGCGAVMRAAPWGIAARSRGEAFIRARDTSVITHGHPSGYLSAAHFAAVVWGLVRGEPLADALAEADAILADEPGREELVAVLKKATDLARKGPPSTATIEALGGGWTGEEAEAIAVLCALTADVSTPRGIEDALWRATMHSGDSDSTAAIAGNLLGAIVGVDGLPPAWVAAVELGEVVDQVARDLVTGSSDRVRYP